ncbi:hypothetical protein LY78DRAFT_660957 [Colletotrichum sublineola]|nr:hypothetical protein LY78DRAFT_660957 [Colletotrichum sublineola]
MAPISPLPLVPSWLSFLELLLVHLCPEAAESTHHTFHCPGVQDVRTLVVAAPIFSLLPQTPNSSTPNPPGPPIVRQRASTQPICPLWLLSWHVAGRCHPVSLIRAAACSGRVLPRMWSFPPRPPSLPTEDLLYNNKNKNRLTWARRYLSAEHHSRPYFSPKRTPNSRFFRTTQVVVDWIPPADKHAPSRCDEPLLIPVDSTPATRLALCRALFLSLAHVVATIKPHATHSSRHCVVTCCRTTARFTVCPFPAMLHFETPTTHDIRG